jgi:hypothetical protein
MNMFSFTLPHCRIALTLAVLTVPSTTSFPQSAPPQPLSSTETQASGRPNLSSADLFPKAIEDYTTPALDRHTAQGDPDPLELEFDGDDPMFTRSITRVHWRIGDPIDLYIIKPVGVRKPRFVLYLYDYPVDTQRYLDPKFCRQLVQGGFAAVGFAPALTGQRYHDRPMKEWFVSEMPEALATTAHDVQMLLNYMEGRGDVDASKVGIYGEGSGATIAILAAAVDTRIQTLDLLSPWGDWPDWVAESTRIPQKERSSFLAPDFLTKVAPLDPLKWLSQLKTPKIRLQNLRNFSEVPINVQKKLESAAPTNAEVHSYEDTKAFMAAIPGEQRFSWVKGQMQLGIVDVYRANTSNAVRDLADKADDARH